MNTSDLSLEAVLPFISELQSQTTAIVSAYVSKNSIPAADLPKLIADTHAAIMATFLTLPNAFAPAPTTKATAQQIKASITRDHLISFEDGKPYKALKRHLTSLGITPDAYRAKHGLPSDYPMVSAAQSEKRSELARSWGLGRKNAANSIAA